MPNPKPSQKQGVQAIERGCSILDLLGKGKQTYSIRELASELKKRRPELPIILMSGADWRAGDTTDGFLEKPFTLDSLAQAIRSVLADSTLDD